MIGLVATALVVWFVVLIGLVSPPPNPDRHANARRRSDWIER